MDEKQDKKPAAKVAKVDKPVDAIKGREIDQLNSRIQNAEQQIKDNEALLRNLHLMLSALQGR